MKSLLIVGAGPMGRVAYSYAMDAFSYSIAVKGFLDSRKHVLDGFRGYPPIVGDVENYAIQPDDCFVVALGDGRERARYAALLEAKGAVFISIVHPRAYIGQNVEIGEGTIIAPSVSITNDVTIGRHVLLGLNTVVSHDCRVDDFATVSPGCHVTGGCHICRGTFLGVHSAVVPRCEVGAESEVYVAAGAVVTQSFPSGRIMGIPAKRKD